MLARFGNRVDTETNERVLARLRALDAAPLQGVVDLVPVRASAANLDRRGGRSTTRRTLDRRRVLGRTGARSRSAREDDLDLDTA